MGRSVDYLSRALFVTFIDHMVSEKAICEHCGSTNTTALDDEEIDIEAHNCLCKDCEKTFEGYPPDPDFEWECLEDNIIDVLKEVCPSLEFLRGKSSRWDGRETRIFAENNLCELGISEYFGLVSVSIRVIEDDYSFRYEGLAKRWINQMWPKIEKKLTERFTVLRKLGSFSNGEGVYEKIEA